VTPPSMLRREFAKLAAVAGATAFQPQRLLSAPPGHGAATGFNFENAIAISGISFKLDNSWSPRRYQVETMAGGVDLFDYNNENEVQRAAKAWRDAASYSAGSSR